MGQTPLKNNVATGVRSTTQRFTLHYETYFCCFSHQPSQSCKTVPEPEKTIGSKKKVVKSLQSENKMLKRPSVPVNQSKVAPAKPQTKGSDHHPWCLMYHICLWKFKNHLLLQLLTKYYYSIDSQSLKNSRVRVRLRWVPALYLDRKNCRKLSWKMNACTRNLKR